MKYEINGTYFTKGEDKKQIQFYVHNIDISIEGKRLFRIPGCRRQDNIKVNYKKIGCESTGCTSLSIGPNDLPLSALSCYFGLHRRCGIH